MTAELPPIQPCSDLSAVRALLAAASLPVADLTAAHLDGFWVCGESSDLTGVVGLEIYGTDALLRSLAVAPAWRGRGLGAALLAHVERVARRRGLAALYLLTTTAEAFFARRGYVRLPREAAPTPGGESPVRPAPSARGPGVKNCGFVLEIDRWIALGEVVVRRLEATTQEPLMRVWKIALLPAALLAATLADPVPAETVDWYDAAYQQCAERSTRGIVECVAAQTQTWDRRLNAAYRALMNLPDERRTALRDAQRLWIRYRDAHRGFYATTESTLRQIAAAECPQVITAWRALELEALSRTPER